MTDAILPVSGGLLNKEIIDHAYLSLGVSDAMFGRTDEEYAAGLSHLRALCGEYPYDQLGFDDAVATVAEESGIDRKWLTAVSTELGVRIGASIGKQLAPAFNRIYATSTSKLHAAVGNKSTVTLAPNQPWGAGRRGYGWRGPTFTDGTQ